MSSLELNLLPIGTVILLNNWEQKLMIYGRKQVKEDISEVWDYVACPYPHGNLSKEYNVFFNNDDILKVLFKGYEDETELILKEVLFNQTIAEDF